MKVELRQGIFYIVDHKDKKLMFSKKYLVRVSIIDKSSIKINILHEGVFIVNISIEEFWNFKNL